MIKYSRIQRNRSPLSVFDRAKLLAVDFYHLFKHDKNYDEVKNKMSWWFLFYNCFSYGKFISKIIILIGDNTILDCHQTSREPGLINAMIYRRFKISNNNATMSHPPE